MVLHLLAQPAVGNQPFMRLVRQKEDFRFNGGPKKSYFIPCQIKRRTGGLLLLPSKSQCAKRFLRNTGKYKGIQLIF